MRARDTLANGLILMLPRFAGEAVYWWHFEDDVLVESGVDVDPASASAIDFTRPGRNLVALLPMGISRGEWTEATEALSTKQAEALAARNMAEQSLGGIEANHAVARIEAQSDAEAAPSVFGVVTARAELSSGLSLLADMGLDPTHVVPSLCVARSASALADAEPALVPVGGDVVFVGEGLVMPAEPALEEYLAPDATPTEVNPDIVVAALRSVLVDPPLDMLVGPFARRRSRLPKVHAQQWKTLAIIVGAILIATLLIGLVTLLRYNAAADAADARALAAIEAKLGDQPDLAAAETALDQRLASNGQGAAAFSVPLSALYQALQPVPQVSVQQLGYLADGTLSAALAAPDAAPVNQLLATLQDAGYRVTANSRVDQSGAAVFEITVRGY